MNRFVLFSVVLLIAMLASSASANDWARFRGMDGSGVAVGQTIPSVVGPDKNVLWKVAVPAGTSSPIIVGEMLLLTSHKDDDRTLHCLNALTGESVWERSVKKGHDEIATAPAGPSTPTPVSDGKSVFVFFPDAGVFAWTLDGTELWRKPTPVSKTMHGLSGSLIYFAGKVFHVVDQLNESFICAYDAKTGDVVWKTDRVSGLTGGYSTPVIYEPADSDPLLLTTGPFEVVAYDPASGARVWWLMGKSNAPVSSPILRGNQMFFCEPVADALPMSLLGSFDKNKDSLFHPDETRDNEAISRLMARIDDNWGNKDSIVDEAEWNKAFGSFAGKGGLVSINLSGTGDVSDKNVNWTFAKGVPYIPGVLVDRNTVFAVDDGGLVTTVNAETGVQVRKGRLKQGNGQYYASPVAAGDHVVLIDTTGVLNILSNSPEWDSVSTCELGEECFATPAIGHNHLYVRTTQSLFCFGETK
jgi:outer membrane protein assembly factor BamB